MSNLYNVHFLRKVIKGEVWFKRCPDCESTGHDYANNDDCKTCDGLGYIVIERFKP